MSILDGKKNIHFVGIGGSGMYPIVQILAAAIQSQAVM